MKYMIMTFGSAAGMMETQSPEWIRSMIQFMQDLNRDLVERGELVTAEGLTDGDTARTVRWQNDEAVVTDGPFAEAKEAIVGFWIVDVKDEARALEIATKIVDCVHGPIEVRQVASGPPEV